MPPAPKLSEEFRIKTPLGRVLRSARRSCGGAGDTHDPLPGKEDSSTPTASASASLRRLSRSSRVGAGLSFHLVGLCPTGMGQHGRQNAVGTTLFWLEEPASTAQAARLVLRHATRVWREASQGGEVSNSGYICGRLGLTLNHVRAIELK